MASTIIEKILSRKVGKDVYPGDIIVSPVDLVFAHDGTMPLVLERMEPIGKSVFDSNKVIAICDHASPSPSDKIANIHEQMRDFAFRNKMGFYENGDGICHQIVLENLASPYKVIIGADSHTTTHGALGAFATGMGSTDVAAIMISGETWLRVPESFKILIEGHTKPNVFSKDVFLHLIGEIGADGATYMSMEFLGDTVEKMSVGARAVMSNMAVEAGAKTGVCVADEKVRSFLRKHGREHEFKSIEPDKGCSYADEIVVEAENVEPMVSCPHEVDKVRSVAECEGMGVDVVCIGTCTNGRLEDLRVAAGMLRDEKVAENTRLIVCPASRRVLLDAMRENLIETFLRAGASILPPSCGFCVGRMVAVGDNERILSTQNRNFKGRMGNDRAEIYLCSPATAAMSAIRGEISVPEM